MASNPKIAQNIQAKIGNKTVAQHLTALTSTPEALDLKKELFDSERHFHYAHEAITDFRDGLAGQPVHIWFFLSENKPFHAWLLKAADFLLTLRFSGSKKAIERIIQKIQPLMDLLYYFNHIDSSIVKALFKLESIKAKALDKQLSDEKHFQHSDLDLSAYTNEAQESLKYKMQVVKTQDTLDFHPKQWLNSLFNKPKHDRIALQTLFLEIFKKYKNASLLQGLYTSIKNEKDWPIDWLFVLDQLSTYTKKDLLYREIAFFAEQLALTGALAAIPNICASEPLAASSDNSSASKINNPVFESSALNIVNTSMPEMQHLAAASTTISTKSASMPQMQGTLLPSPASSPTNPSTPEMQSAVSESPAASIIDTSMAQRRHSVFEPFPARNEKISRAKKRSTTFLETLTTGLENALTPKRQSVRIRFMEKIGDKTLDEHLKALAFVETFLSKDIDSYQRLHQDLDYLRNELVKQPRYVLDRLQEDEKLQDWLLQVVEFLPTLFSDLSILEPAVQKVIHPLIDLFYYFNETPALVDALFRLEVVKEISLDADIKEYSLSSIIEQTYASHYSDNPDLHILFNRMQAQIEYKIRQINQTGALKLEGKQPNEAFHSPNTPKKIPEICQLELKIGDKTMTEHLAAIDPDHILGSAYDDAMYFRDKLVGQPIHILDDLCNNTRFQNWVRRIITTLSRLLLDPQIFNPVIQEKVEPLFELLYYFNLADVTIQPVLCGFEMIKAIPQLKKPQHFKDKNASISIKDRFDQNYERSFGQTIELYLFKAPTAFIKIDCDQIITPLFNNYTGLDTGNKQTTASRLEQACYAFWLITRIKEHHSFNYLEETRKDNLNKYLANLQARYFSQKSSITPYYSINSDEKKVPSLQNLVKEKQNLVEKRITHLNKRNYSIFQSQYYYRYLTDHIVNGKADLQGLFLCLISIGRKRLSTFSFFEAEPYADTKAVVESTKTKTMILEWRVLLEQMQLEGELPKPIAFFAAVLEAQQVPPIEDLDAAIASMNNIENVASPSSMNHSPRENKLSFSSC